MLEHTKMRRTSPTILVIMMWDNKRVSYSLPETPATKKKMLEYKKFCEKNSIEITPWDEATPWDELASDRIKRYSKSGIALRGARLREGYSQKVLAKKCGVSQENLSKMENGKRRIGKKVAEKLATTLKINTKLLKD